MPSLPIKYRPYETRDYEQVKAQLVDVLRTSAKFNPLRLAEPAQEYGDTFLHKLLDLMKDNQAAIIVAVIENPKKSEESEVVGCCAGYIKTQSPADLLSYKALTIGHISDLYVTTAWRQKGIGAALMQRIQAYFKSLECDFIEINVLADNTPAHDLYMKLGYRDTLVQMIKPVK